MSRWREALARFERAEALDRGDYLPEDRYESWAVAYQERWKRLYRQLMGYYACWGDHASVMRTYTRLQQMLAEYFRVEPSPQTQALLEAL
jgi:two-component SAPR family response regulator